MKLAEENLLKIVHNMLLFFFLHLVSCELGCLCSSIQTPLTEPDANFHVRKGGKAVLAACRRFPFTHTVNWTVLQLSQPAIATFVPPSSLPPNPCKSKPDLNSRSLIWFSACTSPHRSREVRCCAALLFTDRISRWDAAAGAAFSLQSKEDILISSRKLES